MQKISLKEAFQENVFDSISVLRINSNGYPYVTLVRATAKGTMSTNVYFGKKSAEAVLNEADEGDKVTSLLADAVLVHVENADGDKRWKVSVTPANVESDYLSDAEMADAFGSRKGSSELIASLKSEFSAKVAEGSKAPI